WTATSAPAFHRRWTARFSLLRVWPRANRRRARRWLAAKRGVGVLGRPATLAVRLHRRVLASGVRGASVSDGASLAASPTSRARHQSYAHPGRRQTAWVQALRARFSGMESVPAVQRIIPSGFHRPYAAIAGPAGRLGRVDDFTYLRSTSLWCAGPHLLRMGYEPLRPRAL